MFKNILPESLPNGKGEGFPHYMIVMRTFLGIKWYKPHGITIMYQATRKWGDWQVVWGAKTSDNLKDAQNEAHKFFAALNSWFIVIVFGLFNRKLIQYKRTFEKTGQEFFA